MFGVGGCEADGDCACSISNTTTDTFLATGLERSSTYKFSVRGHNTGYQIPVGIAPWSAQYTRTTTAGVLPSQVTGLGQSLPAFLNNATQIYAIWSAANGYGLSILRYEISIDGGPWTSVGASRRKTSSLERRTQYAPHCSTPQRKIETTFRGVER